MKLRDAIAETHARNKAKSTKKVKSIIITFL